MRLLEDASGELGRLDAASAGAPESIQTALRLGTIAELACLDSRQPTTSFDRLAAAEGDPLHDAALPASILHWRDLLVAEEARMRGGAVLSAPRFAVVAPTLASYPDRPRLEAIWREPGLARPVLHRALDSAAWAPDVALGEATAALLLCAGGCAEQTRLLPFADVAPAERAAAVAEWRGDRKERWTLLGLAAVARRARRVRLAIDEAVHSLPAEDARLDELGRAAITARRALAELRRVFVTSMPALSQALELSKPAASDALDRLVSADLARELTARARDRVFAYEAACGVATTLAPTSS